MAQMDYADIVILPVLVDIDRTFLDRERILFAVEPICLASCGFHVPADGKHSSVTRDPLLLLLQEVQFASPLQNRRPRDLLVIYDDFQRRPAADGGKHLVPLSAHKNGIL